jgi:hypothetical protein
MTPMKTNEIRKSPDHKSSQAQPEKGMRLCTKRYLQT